MAVELAGVADQAAVAREWALRCSTCGSGQAFKTIHQDAGLPLLRDEHHRVAADLHTDSCAQGPEAKVWRVAVQAGGHQRSFGSGRVEHDCC